MNNFKKLTLSLAFLACHSSMATNQNEQGEYIWNFLTDLPWPLGYDQNIGKPDDLIWAYNEYSSDFFSRINNALPEREVNEAFLTDDEGANITLNQEAEVFVTFIHEGAGYRNSFGYFTFDKENPPTSKEEIDEVIVFPNLSYPHMTNGHRLSLGTFPAGTSIGFFLAANGFSYFTGVKNGYAPHYYSLKGLNPDPTDELRQHCVLLYDDSTSETIIGFEDLPRTWGDNDFNDAVFSVKASPESAIDNANLVSIPDVNDSDADGVLDSLDEFPDDFKRAYSSYYPSASEWTTLAYEDQWPQTDDYDMNDLVIRERFQLIYDGQGNISGFKIKGFIDARGASNHNGFALRLMDIAPSVIDEVDININGITYSKETEDFQTDAVILLWQDSHTFTTTGETGQCSHFNTVKSCTEFEPVPFELDVDFAVSVDALLHSALDFFIFRTNYRGREIHFADYPPTDYFDESQFGAHADTSNPEQNRYFRTSTNLPWAIKVNSDWRHPREYIDVLWAYPDYETWVESSGAQALDWHSTSERDTHFY
ncbi:LruC domain-containing protein [Marinibactrum halimedae]|uniref:LruC domain-containing protein n=1 Tax=Marinibactrum halimedae TaxID=1444977 RepID=A0AA37T6X5_9GAMM|nr:LruC domain-containing protein [Marinibactrum halimedae]MCD9457835.1 LruC domain-containing protein [Marinibactrum halimedae]GLS24791.1 LruC domain-containing protein [Marinibactrum halimedae]